jgi:hypothetical protein
VTFRNEEQEGRADIEQSVTGLLGIGLINFLTDFESCARLAAEMEEFLVDCNINTD